MYLLDEEYLTANDILILASAHIHGEDATWDLVFGFLTSKGVNFMYLDC